MRQVFTQLIADIFFSLAYMWLNLIIYIFFVFFLEFHEVFFYDRVIWSRIIKLI